MFGGIYGIAKGFEHLTRELIVWASDKPLVVILTV
jgi:hypothetical protein